MAYALLFSIFSSCFLLVNLYIQGADISFILVLVGVSTLGGSLSSLAHFFLQNERKTIEWLALRSLIFIGGIEFLTSIYYVIHQNEKFTLETSFLIPTLLSGGVFIVTFFMSLGEHIEEVAEELN